MKIIISPYSAALRSGSKNPKDFPFWPELVALLKAAGHHITQIGLSSEPRIEGVDIFVAGWPLKKLKELMREADTFIAVDNFWQHFVHVECNQKPGIVIWGMGNPKIFGHPENHNIQIAQPRQYPYDCWDALDYDPSVFPSAEMVAAVAIPELALASS